MERLCGLDIVDYSTSHIHCLATFESIEGNQDFVHVVTRVYGHPETIHRPKFWNLLCSLGGRIDKPWLVFGDFNEILHVSEKWGGRARSKKQINDFHEFLDVCELRDLGYNSSPFTWSNNREGGSRISE